MKKNLGKIDRTIRMTLAIIFFILASFYFNGITSIVLYLFTATLFVTSLLGYCPLFKMLRIDTTGKKKIKKRK